MKTKILLSAAAAVGALALATNASAQAFYSDLGAWKSAMGTWSETTHLGDDFTLISGFTTTDGISVGLTGNGEVLTIGSGWATWCCGYSQQVEYTFGATSQTWTLGPNRGFGVFVEPDFFEDEDIKFAAGSGSLTQTVNGSGGAKFFGFVGTGVSSFTLTDLAGEDFAAGDVFSGAAGIPEPATWAIMLVGFGGLGAALRRRKALVVA